MIINDEITPARFFFVLSDLCNQFNVFAIKFNIRFKLLRDQRFCNKNLTTFFRVSFRIIDTFFRVYNQAVQRRLLSRHNLASLLLPMWFEVLIFK